jgi:hypothetical protein
MSKKCIKCCEIKNEKDFHLDSSRNDGLYPYCKACRNRRDSELFASNPRRQLLKQNYYYKKTFGVDKEFIIKLLKEQSGKCKLCGKEITLDSKKTHVDHNHITGKIRGVLCDRCNLMVGLIENKRHLLDKITEYLLQYTNNQ